MACVVPTNCTLTHASPCNGIAAESVRHPAPRNQNASAPHTVLHGARRARPAATAGWWEFRQRPPDIHLMVPTRPNITTSHMIHVMPRSPCRETATVVHAAPANRMTKKAMI